MPIKECNFNAPVLVNNGSGMGDGGEEYDFIDDDEDGIGIMQLKFERVV